MDVLKIEDNRVVITPEALGIQIFKTIWDTDTDVHKGNAVKLLTYVAFMCYPGRRNPYYGEPQDTRGLVVKRELYGDENKPDTEFMILGVLKYKELLASFSPSYPILDATIIAANKLKDYLLSFNLNERSAGGAAVVKPSEVTKIIKEIASMVKAIGELREKVETELVESGKTRKEREIGDYER